MATKSENERIAVLETKVEDLSTKVEELAQTNRDLIATLNKGKGVLATISFLLGSSLIGAVTVITGWIKG